MGKSSNEVIPIVSEAITDALGTPLEELPPLSNVIDPEALEDILSTPDNSTSGGVTVLFRYGDLDVFVHSENIVYAKPADSHQDWTTSEIDVDEHS